LSEGEAPAKLLEEMARRIPSPAALRTLIPKVRAALLTPPDEPDELLRWLGTPCEGSWDEAAWLYYALVAVERTRREGGRATARTDEPFTRLSEALRLDREDPDGKIKGGFDSPRWYDAAAARKLSLDLIDRLNEGR
jgi:hypothetical protein